MTAKSRQNDSTIAAYVLTIETMAERAVPAQELCAQFRELSAADDISVFPAIYWQDEETVLRFINQHPEHSFTEEFLSCRKMGQLACALSHISIWKKLLGSQHKGALVFEDDMYIEDEEGFKKVMEGIHTNPDWDWVRIHVMKMFRKDIPDSPEPQLFIQDFAPWGSAAYYVSREGARKLLENAQCMNGPIDLLMPALRKKGKLNCIMVTEPTAEHHPFEGDKEELQERHKFERMHTWQQRTASTIWTSPLVRDHESVFDVATRQRHIGELRRNGFTVIRGVFDAETVEASRQQIMENRSLLKNTRPTRSCGHLAGFHRYPELESLHSQITCNPVILDFLGQVMNGSTVRSIGLSDITVNRSQPWHKDLVRGRFSDYLDDDALNWESGGGGVYKALFYLQEGASLKIVRGSHLVEIELEDDSYSEPGEKDEVVAVSVKLGDVVIMDIRCSHRGADESAYADGQWDDDPRMLLSTALGADDGKLTRAMEEGNFHRLMDWMDRNP